jgi:hypothetical protein
MSGGPVYPFQYAVPQEPGTKEPQMSINKSNIKVPVDVQDVLEIYEGLWAVSGLAAQAITCDTRGYKIKQYLCKSNTPGELHTWTIDYSFDNVTWYNQYTSGAPEVSTGAYVTSAARYWRASSNNNGGGAHTVDLVLGSVP